MIRVKKSELIEDINNGMTRKDLSNKYNLSTSQITMMLKECGIDKMRAKRKLFEIIPEEESNSPVATVIEEDNKVSDSEPIEMPF